MKQKEYFFFSSRRRHTRLQGDWSSDVCSSDLDTVKRHQQLGFISAPWGDDAQPVKAPFEGIVIGYTSNPLVYRGDALLHLADRKSTRLNSSHLVSSYAVFCLKKKKKK